MFSVNQSNTLNPNVHPEAELHPETHSTIPHPLPSEDHHDREDYKPVPDTGWRGPPPVPSHDGGDGEPDFLNKPPYTWKSEGDAFKPMYRSECFCGNLAFEFHGSPIDAKYCHCQQCQHLHGAPFQWAVIFPKTSVRMVQNLDKTLHFFSAGKRSGGHYVPCKASCDNCRSPMFDEGRHTVLAFPSAFKFRDGKVPQNFQPPCHIFYKERIMDVPDGIPKWTGHKGASELMQELRVEDRTMAKHKGVQATPIEERYPDGVG